jgi:hypothetical protein
MATASPTGQRRGTATLRAKGSHTTHWPQGDGHRREAFAPPLTGHPLATKGRGRLRPAPDLREATGSLPRLAT